MSKLFIAGEVFHGAGTLSELANIKGTKAVIVTGGSSMRKSGTLDKAVAYLTEAGIETKMVWKKILHLQRVQKELN